VKPGSAPNTSEAISTLATRAAAMPATATRPETVLFFCVSSVISTVATNGAKRIT
jgi:hypothetical protein